MYKNEASKYTNKHHNHHVNTFLTQKFKSKYTCIPQKVFKITYLTPTLSLQVFQCIPAKARKLNTMDMLHGVLNVF